MYLSQSSKVAIAQSMVNTAMSGGSSVSWYYNPNTCNYQYWVGEGRPSNLVVRKVLHINNFFCRQ